MFAEEIGSEGGFEGGVIGYQGEQARVIISNSKFKIIKFDIFNNLVYA